MSTHTNSESQFIKTIIGWYQNASTNLHKMNGSVVYHNTSQETYLLHLEFFTTESIPVNIIALAGTKVYCWLIEEKLGMILTQSIIAHMLIFRKFLVSSLCISLRLGNGRLMNARKKQI